MVKILTENLHSKSPSKIVFHVIIFITYRWILKCSGNITLKRDKNIVVMVIQYCCLCYTILTNLCKLKRHNFSFKDFYKSLNCCYSKRLQMQMEKLVNWIYSIVQFNLFPYNGRSHTRRQKIKYPSPEQSQSSQTYIKTCLIFKG